MTECSPSWQESIKENAKEENFMSTLSKEHVKQLVRENNCNRQTNRHIVE